MDGLGGGDGGFGEAGGDEFELAGERGDVAAGPDTREVGLHHLVDDQSAFGDLQPPVLQWSEGGFEAELQQDRVDLQLDLACLVLRMKQPDAFDRAVAGDGADLVGDV